jgi:hypothetical protein
MCREELLLKVAVVGLVGLDAAPADMAALLACYTGACVCVCVGWAVPS